MALFSKKVTDELDSSAPSADEGPSFVGKLLKSKLFIIAVAVVVIAILVGVLMNVLTGNQSQLGYFDTITSIFANELGSFSYTFTIETGERGTVIKEVIAPSLDETLENVDMESTIDKPNQYEFSNWDKYADIKEDYWEYPVFRINIAGTTMSLEPLKTDFTITLATPSYNNKLTEVIAVDDVYYIDVESLYNWLLDSGDKYLVSLASTIPHGSKWLEIPASEFAIPSRYAENGDEQGLSEAHSLVTLYRRFLTTLQLSMNSIKGSVGERGVDRREDVVFVNYTGSDAADLVNSVKGIFSQSGAFYDALVNSGTQSGLYNESQATQARREKDNFVVAMQDMNNALQRADINDMQLQASGQVRQYINGYNNQQIEGTFGVQFRTADSDYILKFSGIRSGDTREIMAPGGSKTQNNADLYLECINHMVDYFNFTAIKTDVKLNLDPQTISDAALDKFIELVNSAGSAGQYISRGNVAEYIDKYINMDEASAQSANDIINIRLVSDLVTALNSIVNIDVTPSQGVGGDTDPKPVAEKYPDIYWTYEGVEFVFRRNAELSNKNFFVADCEIINKSDEDVTLNALDFSLRDLVGSMYPANNETLIRGYNSTFDMSELVGEFELPSHNWMLFQLYFVNVNTDSRIDLFYGDTSIETIIVA